MNEIKIFESPEFGKVRAIEINGEPWLVGKDVAAALGYGNTKDALSSHVDEEDRRILQRSEIATFENHIPKSVLPVNFVSANIPNRGLTIINESGLYSLVLSSKRPGAKKFRRWVTSEVLPSIRRNGGYIAGQESMTDEELMARALVIAQNKIEERNQRISVLEAENKQQQETISIMKPKALFADSVSVSKNSILMRDMAKILIQNGIKTGQNRLFDHLRNEGYLIKCRGSSYNMPTQRAMEMGLFEVKEDVVTTPNGDTFTSRTTYVTGKGQQYFVNLFVRNK